MKLSLVVTFLALSSATCIVSASSSQREKRFIVNDFKKAFDDVKHKVDDVVDKGKKVVNDAASDVKDKVQDILKKAKEGIDGIRDQVNKDTYEAAEETFNEIKEIEGKVDFEDAVQALIPLIDTDFTEGACQLACEDSASSVLGADAKAFANLACPPLCKAALAQLKDIAEG